MPTMPIGITSQGRPDRDAITAFRFLDELPDEDLALIEQQGERLDAVVGTTLIHEGDADDRLFLICSGELAVHQQGQPRRALGPGDIVGEIAATPSGHGFTRTATVTVEESAELIAVPADLVRRLAAAHPRLRAYFDSVRSQRLTFDAITQHLREGGPDAS
jgi:CRP-like cAMP-binding protein